MLRQPIVICVLLLLSGTAAAQEQSFVVRVTPGTYVLSVAADGMATLSPVSVLTPDGGPVTPPTPSPTGTVKKISRKGVRCDRYGG